MVAQARRWGKRGAPWKISKAGLGRAQCRQTRSLAEAMAVLSVGVLQTAGQEVNMLLNVDDFGCVPDGRCLERVSIRAVSPELSAADGTLRPSDVGNNIAIPGAVDLVATISELLRRKDVARASMQAGSTAMIAVLTPDEGFFQADLHQGQRITVAGAGPAGGTLVSDVVNVTSRTTLELADSAATTVTDSLAILNRRDRVGLSDYARATAVDVTVDLAGRVVTDARMTVGQRGLESPTAGFSSLDLGKPVTIRAAGRLVTTIQAVSSSTQVTLAAPAQRAVTDGPADVWKTDSRPGFQQLLAALGSPRGAVGGHPLRPWCVRLHPDPQGSEHPVGSARLERPDESEAMGGRAGCDGDPAHAGPGPAW